MEKIEVLIDEKDIRDKVTELGELLTKEYEGKNLLLLLVLNGSFIFAADLARAIRLMDVEIRCIRAKSYVGTHSTGVVQVNENELLDFSGRNVLIVEDIIDTGNTLSKLKAKILEQEPESLKIAAFLDKPSRRVVELEPDYSCFVIPDKFVVGYGLDYDEKYRQLPYVGEMI